ncbi:DUF4367 domain-containing protein [Paenibacillus woosongensis]|uniref:DUF4367 domain-containing protein n=1 Tax=Paenibacillus woosongensis TaxID=307580 RepID=UPI0018C2513B|nr:DUF4367 domain-containing protein [Paenibacillus woosongensis]
MTILKRSSPREPVYPAEFNILFDEAFDEATKQLPPYIDAYKQQSWNAIQPKLMKQARRRKRWKWLRRYEVIALVAAFMLFSAILFTPPIVTEAVSPIYQELRSWGNGMSQIIFGKGRQPDESGVTYALNASYDEADVSQPPCPKVFPLSMKTQLNDLRESLPFSLPKITYMPRGYRFNSAEPITGKGSALDPAVNGQIEGVYLLFETRHNQQLTMMFKTLKEDEIIRMPYEENIETVTLNNGTIAYFTPGKTAQITFMIGDIYFMAAGGMDKEELLKIANGLNI